MTAPVTAHLHDGWTLHQHRRAEGAPAVEPIPATVPGGVFTDLLAAGVIPDPFESTNEAAVAWVAGCDWRFHGEFTVDDAHLAHDHLELCFDGLDTLAEISINDTIVAVTENMHRRYRFDVAALARPGVNTIDVVVRSATDAAERRREREGVWPTANFGRPFNYIRKMACSWGWDWGPWLTDAGMWRPVRLVAWSAARLGDVRPHVSVDADDHGRLDVEVDVAATGGATVAVAVVDPDGVEVGRHDVAFAGDRVRVALDVGVVRRWWPHTLGDQPLYRLDVSLLQGGQRVDERSMRVGFRTVELDTTPDATGSAFRFLVNGRPMFVHGINWIPDDVFVSRIDAERYRERIGQAIDANVDLLRVWGGGIYEDDAFYDACDELGVLVWQDFLFACAAYPEHLLADEVEAEARDNVSRLMHHTSLAIWNGNNENIWGFWDWAWQEVLDGRPWGAGFYHELLPSVCAELDPGRPYWPGSPFSGSTDVAPNADAQGCVHVWDVWNQIDLVRYRDRTPRFASEFGWQAPPSVRTLEEYLDPAELNRSSDAWFTHQKAADGDLKLDRGIEPRFGAVDDFDAFCYAAQVVQARAIRTGVEHFRSLKPYCMGTVWWQLNDCWPVTSWAVIDSRTRRKPAWYALRDAYRPRLLTVQPRGDRLVVFAINDTDRPWHVATEAVRRSATGDIVSREPVELAVAPDGIASFTLAPTTGARSDVLTVGDVDVDDGRAWWWFALDREARLPTPNLSFDASHDGDDLVVTVTSDVVVRDLAIFPERVRPDATVDRQLVHLLPGEPATFRIRGVAESDLDALTTPPALRHTATLTSLDRPATA